jgi:hypothetical protein
MGFFSWKCAVSDQSISNLWSVRDAEPCGLVLPDDSVIEERSYDGYGVFGGLDVYAWVAWANGLVPECATLDDLLRADADDFRGRGIAIACYTEDNASLKFPIKIVSLDAHSGQRYADLPASKNCPDQGFFYFDEEV